MGEAHLEPLLEKVGLGTQDLPPSPTPCVCLCVYIYGIFM